ncbi:MAG: hypothetical protein QUV05_23425 [Phycisphaerae bacterium]|nr:hypothetical protein [Phycisphaerae bacterium]
MRSTPTFAIVTLTSVLVTGLAGCGPRDNDSDTCDPTAPACAEGLVCSPFSDGTYRCAQPIKIQGSVVTLADDTPIEGALVQAVDINGAPAGTPTETAADGSYTLTVPAIRDADGTPVDGIYTLRVQAQGYQEFPTAIRPALPLDVTSAVLTDGGYLLQSSLTTVKLMALPGDVSQLGSIKGTIQATVNAGLLVVAEGATTTLTGFSDANGQYVIFNVSAGSYTVQGYAAGAQLIPANVTLTAGEAKTDVNLTASNQPLSTVSGNVQIVNAPGGSVTSVVLAVESTFVEAAGRGAVPLGLRSADVTGAFTISNVPDGRYVVLAAFENDGLVRDPDQTIGGTQIVRIELPDPELGNTLTLSEGFKVTAALNVVSPGADQPEQVDSPTPTLQWADDSSEEGYEILVLDAFGNEVWTDSIGPVSGSAVVSHVYAGPALEPGMFYQFRATSFREKTGTWTAISTTEDLKGVFYYLEQ